MKKLFCILLIFAAFISCRKKDYPQPGTSSGTPVFYFNGTIAGNPVSFQAGTNNYYMYSSFVQDANNVYNFMGTLRQFNCSNCSNRLQIQINDFQPSAVNAPAVINTSLSPGYYSLQIPGGASTEYNVQFSGASQNGTAQSWAWDFGDGNTSSVQNPLHTYSRPGAYNVSLAITFTTSVTNSINYTIRIGNPDGGCYGGFGSSAVGNAVTFSNSVSATAPYTFSWDFGDGNVGSGPTPSHTYAGPGLYKVCMHMTDADNRIMDFCRNTPTQNYTGEIAIHYYSSPITTNPNPNSLSNIIITWIDASGTIYTSNNSSQPPGSYFKVISVDPYDNNENNQTTRKVHAQIKCMLYNGSNSIQLDNADAVIALAYH